MKSILERGLMGCGMILIATLSGTSIAQSDWHASIGGQFSFAELESDGDLVKSRAEPGGGLTLGISYSLGEQWSLHSGAELGFIQSSVAITNYSDVEDTTDLEGESFEFRYTLDRYTETQKSTMVSIPVAIQYESTGATRFYGRLGASYKVFLSPKSEASASRLETTGFFDRFNAELDRPRFAGFGRFDQIDFREQDLDLKNSINATLELGFKQELGTNQWAYIGAFVEYGLNDLLENNGTSLVEYNQEAPTDFIANNSLNASNQQTGAALFDKLNLNVVGIKLRYEFDF